MNNNLRVIDANVNRAREGLRVIEDCVRLILDSKVLTKRIKTLRGEFKSAVDTLPATINFRRSNEDVGSFFSSKNELHRENLSDLVTSNFKRAQEALRVLEEFSKLDHPQSSIIFKRLRFQLYTIEKETADFFAGDDKKKKLEFDLYFILDPEYMGGRKIEKLVNEVMASGIKIIQLRDKLASRREYFNRAKKVRHLTQGITFIVNDYPDIALAVGADGVHLGQDDLPINEARMILGKEKIIGVSAGNMKEAIQAEREGADYVGFGPVFATPVKAADPVGLRELQKVVKKIKIPVIAIGGIDQNNIGKLPCRRVAVVRAISEAVNIRQAVKGLRAGLDL